ncbi:transketolase family protein [Cupriavidus numazuensis]|uniref:Apulose-4-phosphate transketolase subunit B n=1 Tax=Cupriavidus numazuensis TaxID=221992 RepID=A0ABN7Q1A8_9BURK|nr:transketolase [Cupriavidus numazuensis]CAG2148853.1 Apulose-4-phosphate transketolase subunit B [Cupriavidus numazuensis]
MRNAFIEELVTLATEHPHIALIVGDLGYSVIEPFADRFPDRFINAGVSEQNMTGLAAGMASEGYHVFTYSIANFPTFRCAEQIRNDIAYHRLPVTVVAVGGGLAYGALGYSHHAVQDYALMRSMPNMLIAAPGDPLETQACMRYLIANPGPSYLRLGKAGEPKFHTQVPKVQPGQWLKVREGDQKDGGQALLSTGAGLAAAISRAEACDGTKPCVYSLPLWGMDTKVSQPAQIQPFSSVVTLEDHLRDAGFGSWLLESVASEPSLLPRLSAVALDPLVCGTVGSQAMLNALGGLTLVQ